MNANVDRARTYVRPVVVPVDRVRLNRATHHSLGNGARKRAILPTL